MMGFGSVRWVIQDNLIAQNDASAMKDACSRLGIEVFPVQVIPFSEEFPEYPIDEKSNVYYGATRFINAIHKRYRPKGIFYSESDFSMENYIRQWNEYVLNSQAKKMKLHEFIERGDTHGDHWFIRPDADDKSFEGGTMTFEQANDWYQKLVIAEDMELSLGNTPMLNRNTSIVAGPAYRVEKEWRNFIVDGRIVTSSLYRKNFKLNKSSVDIPQSMLSFVHERCSEYLIHRAFVMDIGLCGGEYYIIECGCINSAGFYHADVGKIIEAVSFIMSN